MTETNMTGDLSGQLASGDTSTLSTPSTSQEIHAERMVPQSKVDEIVHQANLRGYQRGIRETQIQSQPSQQTQGSTWNNENVGLGGIPQQQDKEELRRLLKEVQREEMGQYVANSFLQKLNAGIQKNPEMREILSQINYESIPQIVDWANQLPNTADVIHELGKNSDKLYKLKVLLEVAPQKAYSELQSLSQSIATNKVAVQNAKTVSEPLSQVTPSYVGLDNGQMTVADWKRKLRG